MMGDIVERLRGGLIRGVRTVLGGVVHDERCLEAADEIERLRAELRSKALDHLATLGQCDELIASLAAKERELEEARGIIEGLSFGVVKGRVFGYASRHSVYGPWASTCGRAGIPYVPPHQAGRHSFATALDGAGWTASQIADAGRWRSPRLVAETYTHPKDSSRRAADLIGRILTDGESGTVVTGEFERRNRK